MIGNLRPGTFTSSKKRRQIYFIKIFLCKPETNQIQQSDIYEIKAINFIVICI